MQSVHPGKTRLRALVQTCPRRPCPQSHSGDGCANGERSPKPQETRFCLKSFTYLWLLTVCPSGGILILRKFAFFGFLLTNFAFRPLKIAHGATTAGENNRTHVWKSLVCNNIRPAVSPNPVSAQLNTRCVGSPG